ncbi:MAG: FtsW/RodA/SpoVE family cell cycle protein [Bdellovibrionaceae bacterium]|nr:FtsW/RodA/SpoVE family cell cycle protein [Pseudobdellovibrionaceae bacterium]
MKNKFVQDVLNHVNLTEAHTEIEKELNNHMDEMRESLAEFIPDKNKLESEVARRMGPADDVGKKLNDIHRPQWDWILILAVGPLLMSGLFMLTPYGWAPLHLLWTMLGVGLAAMLSFMKPTNWVKYSTIGFVATLVVTLSAFASSVWMDGQPYIYIDGLGIRIKIIDLSSALFTLFAPGILIEAGKSKSYGWLWMILISVPFWIFSKTGSLFPLVAYGAAVFGMMVAGQISLVSTVVAIAFSVFSFSIWAETAASQTVVMNSHTDLALRSVYQASSWLAFFTIACGTLLCLRLFTVSLKVKMTHAKIAVVGIASFITLNILWGTLASFGYAPVPVAGLNFPFVSYGGSLMVAQIAMIGVVLGFYRRKSLSISN